MSGSHSPEKMLRDIAYALDQSAIVAITDQTGKIFYVNRAVYKNIAIQRGGTCRANHRHYQFRFSSSFDFSKICGRQSAGEITWRGEICNKAKDGSYYWVDTTIVPFLNDKGKPYQYISIRYDITESKESEQMIRDSCL